MKIEEKAGKTEIVNLKKHEKLIQKEKLAEKPKKNRFLLKNFVMEQESGKMQKEETKSKEKTLKRKLPQNSVVDTAKVGKVDIDDSSEDSSGESKKANISAKEVIEVDENKTDTPVIKVKRKKIKHPEEATKDTENSSVKKQKSKTKKSKGLTQEKQNEDVEEVSDHITQLSPKNESEPVKKAPKSKSKATTVKRKADNHVSNDPNQAIEPVKRKKTKAVGNENFKVPSKSTIIPKRAKKKNAEKVPKKTPFQRIKKIIESAMEFDEDKFDTSSSSLENYRYGPLDVSHISYKKREYPSSSSNDEGDENQARRSFQVRIKPKPDDEKDFPGAATSSQSGDFVATDFKCDKKKIKKIYFDE